MTSDPQQANPRKLFVGNLPYTVTDQQLSDIFSQYGELVDVKVIIDRMTGRSKGIAFVEFSSEDAASQAIEATNGMELDGRAMVVNVARPFQPRERSQGGFGGDRRGGSGGGGGFRGGRGGDRNDRRSSY